MSLHSSFLSLQLKALVDGSCLNTGFCSPTLTQLLALKIQQ